MVSVVSPVPSVKPTRKQRKPLEPVSVSAYFVGGATRADVVHGAAVLSITDNGSTDEKAYWCEALFSEDRSKCVGFRLRPMGSGEIYDVPRSLDSCTCADATYRAERPGGCRHQQALRQALPAVAKDNPAPAVSAA